MSNATLSKVRMEALELSESERAELARDLLTSLDGPPDRDAASAWDAEISRRLDEFNAGRGQVEESDDVIRRIRQRLTQKK